FLVHETETARRDLFEHVLREELFEAGHLLGLAHRGRRFQQIALELATEDARRARERTRAATQAVEAPADELADLARQRQRLVERLGFVSDGARPMTAFVSREQAFADRGAQVLGDEERISVGLRGE